MEKTRCNPVSTDFERLRAKAGEYLRQHDDHVALQRLRRNRQLTGEDLSALLEKLLASGAGDRDALHRPCRPAGRPAVT